MKKQLFLSLTLIFALNSKAQNGSNVEDNLFRINILTPGLTFEKAIGEKSTVCLDANIGLVFVRGSEDGLSKTPFGRLQYRQYYNFEKRASKGKNILSNSGNYLALNTSYYFKNIGEEFPVNRYDGLTIGATWGLQRTFKSGLNINLNTGWGYNFSNRHQFRSSPIINFTLGWVIFNKKT